MNLQSKFGYCIITQTLNIALCKRDGITDRQPDGQTDKQMDGRTIQLLYAPADLSGLGHKTWYQESLQYISSYFKF